MAKEIEYINVAEDPGALYYFMRKHGFLNDDAPVEMPEDFDELNWFDGDPDMIKIDGQHGLVRSLHGGPPNNQNV